MHFSYILLVVTIASTIILTNAERLSTCRREPSIFKDFDINRIAGHWYAYSKHSHDFEAGCDCLTTEVIVDSTTLETMNCCQMTGVSNVTQKCEIGITNSRLTNPTTKEALFTYTRGGSTIESNVWVVDTDYEHYLIANGCDRVSDVEERELFWILSREREITAAEVNKIDEVLRTHNFEKNKIIRQRHGVDVCTSKRPTRTHGTKGKM